MKYFLFWLTIYGICSCSDAFIKTHYINQDFSIYTTGTELETNVFYGATAVLKEEVLYSAGWNESYIILKTYPVRAKGKVAKNITNFFIIDIAEYEKDPNQMASKGLYGPFSQEEFTKKRKQLKVPSNIKFEVVYDG